MDITKFTNPKVLIPILLALVIAAFLVFKIVGGSGAPSQANLSGDASMTTNAENSSVVGNDNTAIKVGGNTGDIDMSKGK